jgi:hypothetical protein
MLPYGVEINCYFSVLCPNLWLFGEIVSQPDCISQLNEKKTLLYTSNYCGILVHFDEQDCQHFT